MSATDVAYAQLVAAMRRVQREADASYGIGEAERSEKTRDEKRETRNEKREMRDE